METRIILGGSKSDIGHSVIQMKLKERTDKGICFTASGLQNYYFSKRYGYDYEGGGQCLDNIAKDYPDNQDVQTIVKLWKKYHLNDMNAGTPRQTKYLESLGKYKSYNWACEELEKVDLLYDKEYKYPCNKCGTQKNHGYRYGSAWLYREIPKKDLKQIKQLIKKYKVR
jgi:hypothetical protein